MSTRIAVLGISFLASALWHMEPTIARAVKAVTAKPVRQD